MINTVMLTALGVATVFLLLSADIILFGLLMVLDINPEKTRVAKTLRKWLVGEDQ